METIPEGLLEFKILEKTIFEALCRVGRELIGDILWEYDLRVLAGRDTREYRMINFGTTTIKTLMGEVPYRRRYYKKKTGGHVYLLDDVLGVSDGYGLISANLAEEIVAECAEKSYRKSAKTISSLTGQSISAMGAWGVVQRFGEKIERQRERLKELEASEIVGQLGNHSSSSLFSEYDEIWLSMQKEERRRKGSPVAQAAKKEGKKPMRIATAYTGWSQGEDGRYRTENKIAYAAFGEAAGFIADFETLLSHHYDMDGVERRVANGDGASWIRTAAAESGAILQLDPYHRSQAIIKGIRDRGGRKRVFDAIRAKDVPKVLSVLADLIAEAENDAERKKIGDLFGYFFKNKDSLLTWQEREIKLPAPPEGIQYRNLGIQESSNCNLITLRMKHRKGSWSKQGGNHMAKMLCLRNTIGLDLIFGLLPAPQAVTPTAEPLSAAQTPMYDGEGYGGEWLHAAMPFEQAFRTNGREAIRRMLRLRPLSDRAFM